MDWPRRWLARLGTLGLALIVVVVLVIVGFFASLPEIVRQVVVRQVPKAIGRQITIEDIDLNLFTGNLAIKKLRLAERTGPQAFVEFERLEARLALLSLVRQNIHLRDLRLVAPAVRVVRGTDGKLNFDDLMPAVQERPLAREPTKWTFTLDHAAIEGGRVVVEDRAVSPAADWSIQDFALETSGVSTRPNSPPGRLKGSLRLGAAALEVRWDSFQQAPVRVAGTVKLTGFNLTRVRPYLPPTLSAAFASGTLGIDLKVAYTRTEQGLQSARASGEAAVENAALVAPGTTDTLVGFTRLGVGLKRFDLEGHEVALSLVELTGFDARVRRDKSGQIDLLAIFSKPAEEAVAPKTGPARADAGAPKTEPAPATTPATPPAVEAAPKPWKVRVEKIKIDGAKLALTDESVQPAVRFAAVLGTDLAVEYAPTAEGESTVAANGDVTVSSIALDRPGTKESLVALASLGVGLKRFDLAGREVTLSRVEVKGLDARIRRSKTGDLDILAVAKGGGGAAAPPAKAETPRPAAAPAPARPQPAVKPWKVAVEQTRIGGAKVAFVDETVNPAAQLNVTKLDVGVDNLTWPVRGPAAVTLSAALPGNGTLKVQGPVVLDPFDAQLTIAIRDAAIEPYQPYMPVPARFTGRFNGDSKNRLAFKDGKTIIASKGTSWAEQFEARLPDADHALVAIERMDLVDIDFDWPNKAIVAKAGFKRPAIEIERNADGTLDIVKAFGGPAAPTVPNPKEPSASTPPPAAPSPAPAASSAPAAAPAKPKGLLEAMDLQLGEIHLEEGTLRFIDRGTEPAFSEDFSKMDLLVTGLSNHPDQKAKLVFTSVVGDDGGLEIRGDIGEVGAPLYLDLAGEIRDLDLPAVNPYSDKAIAWLIRQGDLKYKFTVKVENDQLTATNQVVVSKLRVAKAKRVDDQVKSRLGLPLGLIIALIKDSDGNIVLNVPISGSLKDPKFDLADVIWSSIKNVLVNVLASPFRLIGGLFSKGDKIEEPKVNPVTFPAGSMVLTPSMEQHLLRVADFMRQTPYVTLTMHPVVGSADLEAIKSTEVAAKLQQFAKEKDIADPPKILAAYFKEKLPDEKPPKTVEEQLQLLRAREPVPEAKVKEMEDQRVAATKDRLVKREGIQDKRLIAGEPNKPPSGAKEGMVEFTVGGTEE